MNAFDCFLLGLALVSLKVFIFLTLWKRGAVKVYHGTIPGWSLGAGLTFNDDGSHHFTFLFGHNWFAVAWNGGEQ